MASAAEQAATAQLTFETENNVQTLDAETAALFRYDEPSQRAIGAQRPWRDNPRHFKQCALSSCILPPVLTLAAACASPLWRW